MEQNDKLDFPKPPVPSSIRQAADETLKDWQVVIGEFLPNIFKHLKPPQAFHEQIREVVYCFPNEVVERLELLLYLKPDFPKGETWESVFGFPLHKIDSYIRHRPYSGAVKRKKRVAPKDVMTEDWQLTPEYSKAVGDRLLENSESEEKEKKLEEHRRSAFHKYAMETLLPRINRFYVAAANLPEEALPNSSSIQQATDLESIESSILLHANKSEATSYLWQVWNRTKKASDVWAAYRGLCQVHQGSSDRLQLFDLRKASDRRRIEDWIRQEYGEEGFDEVALEEQLTPEDGKLGKSVKDRTEKLTLKSGYPRKKNVSVRQPRKVVILTKAVEDIRRIAKQKKNLSVARIALCREYLKEHQIKDKPKYQDDQLSNRVAKQIEKEKNKQPIT